MKNENLVWYVGYGSNIFKDRFLCYITGGRPTGSKKNYDGCRDTSLPTDDKPTTINHEFYFAKKSSAWNGGIGFVNIQANNQTSTLARMYLITKQQLADIAKQETGSDDYMNINFEEAILAGNTIFKNDSWYGKLLYLGDNSGYPIFTLTCENNWAVATKPSAEYLQTIIRGICQTHKLKKSEIVSYFIDKRGVSGNYSLEELANLIEPEYENR